MPATEQTWYDQKLLHVVFGFTALILLISNFWMFGKDHDREWKGYQRKFRAAEQSLTNWRINDQMSQEKQRERELIADQLAAARLAPIESQLYPAFKSEIQLERERLEQPEFDFTKIDGLYETLGQSSESGQADRQTLVDAKQASARGLEAVVAAQEALNQAADPEAKSAAQASLDQADADYRQLESAVETAQEKADSSLAAAVKDRERFFDALTKLANTARAREDEIASRRKFRSADFDAARATLDLMVRDDLTDQFADQQKVIDGVKSDLDEITLERQAATAHRSNLQKIIIAMASEVDLLAEKLKESNAEKDRLEGALGEREVKYLDGFLPGKKFLELPILDAFNSPLKIDNLWTEGLTIPYGSYGEVRRFDRCTTCHQGIAKTAPGSAVEPAYEEAHDIELVLQTPDASSQGSDDEVTLASAFGFQLAPSGLLDDEDVTVSSVEPLSLAAKSGLQVGDIFRFVRNDKVVDRGDVPQFLLDDSVWGAPVTITVQRGMPQPFASHPRLDLFVGSLSPHKMSMFACTSCHEGQGSATSFKWASHAPNTTDQAKDWADDHGWFNNHHWIYPMFPKRFAESSCLRCHHDVNELEPSSRFPDPPAPKVVSGYHLIQDYGCFGCHEINGYDGPDSRVGPDLRLEPNYFAAAATIKADPAFDQLDKNTQRWAKTLIKQPEADHVRHRLADALAADAASESPVLTARSHSMAEALKDTDTPGTYRRVGPSLRYVKDKLGEAFLVDWIREPMHFRPNTKMPQFFGLWDHLDPPDRELAQKYEEVEIRATVAYLLDRSEPFAYTSMESGVAEASAERGKVAFEVRGCLACHKHGDFPEITADQGPDLTNVADKFTSPGTPDAMGWLYTWLKDPTNYHARTKMPDLILTPEEDADGNLVDPAADIAAYLMTNSEGWQPLPVEPLDTAALESLSMEYLTAAFPQREAEQYAREGIPQQMAESLKGAEIELVGAAGQQEKMMYIGRKTIGKYGCYACHDIPGFETAKPIGAALAEWGRKESSKLAFEHILEYLHKGHGGGHGAHSEGEHHGDHQQHGHDDHSHEVAEHDGHSMKYGASEHDPSEDYFIDQIEAHDRSGFIWQKLREPRSYDYKKTANKSYNERLRMPMFPLNVEQREAVMTFVLGLVATPPTEKFVYQGDPRSKALADGLAVLNKYNCAGCHVLESETWVVQHQADEFSSPPGDDDFPFLEHGLADSLVASSGDPDARRGFLTTHLQGMPAINNDDATVMTWDEDWEPIEADEIEEYSANELVYPIQLWKPAAIGGEVHNVGRTIGVPAASIKERREAHGGDLAKYLLTKVLDLEKESNPNANGTEAWGWVPPPLIGEGQKVQPGWLHNFLLDPHPIRPAVFLRMPKFNMSPDEATTLVNYFAAKDQIDYPFEYDPRTRDQYLADSEATFDGDEDRLDHAMKIVTNANYCVKCHLVGDFMPEGSVRALAPNLQMAQDRLRPDYLREWIANPLKVLPYTPMPVNVTYKSDSPHLGGVEQSLFPGTSIEQLDGLVDLLVHYGTYLSQKNDIGKLVKEAAASAPAAEQSSDSDSDADEGQDRVGMTNEGRAEQLTPPAEN